ncbi:MAG: hypothetical protein WC130_11330 [Kiritimatiellia bacterium]
MKVRLLIGANAYACITQANGRQTDIRLNPGKSAVKSLRESAAEYLERARHFERMATLAGDAADVLEKGN